jgi:uncharacterized protein (DUF4415 family)
MVEHALYLLEKQRGGKGRHIMTISQERLREIASISDKEIDTKDIPELDANFWENATLSFKGKPINELTSQEKEEFIEYRNRIMAHSLGLDQETILIDEDITAWFKMQGTDYHARINAVLRDYVEAHR